MRKSLFLLLAVLFLAGQAFAQSRTVTGKVTSADDGQPVIGAAVIVKGTSTGAVTNPDGIYTIQAPEGATLVFRSVGMKDQEVALKTSNTINVVLQADVTHLTETVVTANAIRRDKSSLGYAAPTLKNEDLTKAQVSSPLNALAGKVAGVNISSSAAAPGSSSRIVIRGGSSIAGNNQALMVVDGVPIDNTGIIGNSNGRTGGTDARSSIDFGNRGNDINPDDIESITVLKGPAAASLYGSRASNGALVITTKTGKKLNGKKNEVTFNSSVTFSNVLKLPELQNEYGQGGEGEPDPRENFSWGPKFDGQEKEWGQSINGVRLKKPYVAQPDNVKNFFELGKAFNNNIALSGAGEKTTYYLSLNSLNANGVMPGNSDKYNKYGVRFNGSAQLNNKFTTSVSVNYTKINSNMIQGGQGPGSVYDNVIQTPRDIPLDKMSDLNNPYYGMGGIFDADGNEQYGYYGAYTTSPYFLLKNYRNINDVDRVTGNFTIAYKPLEWLDITERLGGDIYSDRRQFKYPKYSVIPADDAGNYSADANINSSTGKYELDQYNLSEITHDLMVTARKQFNPDFNASLMVGHNVRMRNFTTLETQTNQANGLVIPGWYSLDNSNGPVYTFDERQTRRLVGLYGELNLDYRHMLYVGFTARNDWSSTLPPGRNSFFYPSVNGSFVFTELMQGSAFTHILNYGKLRASWAQVGNDANPYLLRSYYRKTDIAGGFGNTTFPFNGVPGFTVDNQIGNPDLKPEITTAFEIGTELNFLDNRLSVDFSYYRNRSKDQILPVPIAPTTGYAFKVLNTGLVENKGIEVSLRGTPIRTASGFTLELYGTYTKNDNMVLDIAGGVDQVILGGVSGMSIVAAKGRPYGTFYAQDIKRDPQGHVIISPEDGMPLLTDQAVYLGSFNPKYMASAGANLSYKGFSFGILFDTKQGNKFYSRTKDIMDFVGTAPETVVGGRDPQIWANSVYESEPGKYSANTQYTYSPQDWFTNKIPAGQHIVDGSYVRLREVSLSYRLPASLLNRTPFGGASIGIFGNNLALWTAKENVYADPEVNSGGATNQQGFDYTAQPSLRNFGANLKITF
ncbi:TonB-linked outer membrane protein, SusC/RagA family [Chitinophaga rupis]|uniref:TonB-linked outer membrane protein, SusC/RagA family n=1 Tax=Chitinophaga rupis TaxID=573321 RepID=A0A1H7IT55_9BACT|nr:SusC/RagA family TonB-linked outer membrane protein [Chitinophaga rupis]SEK63975.1 TonB-linked outer membrane protein, SusC/RagA family [Chitinophaga rupis]